MKIAYLLNMPRQVPFASLIAKTCPNVCKIIITNFHKNTEFNLGKNKYLDGNLQDENIEEIRNEHKNTILCNSYLEFINAMKDVDICISQGREYFIIHPDNLPNVKKYIALSLDRCYFNRLLQVIPEYKGKLDIFMHSHAWFEENECGKYLMDNIGYEVLEQYKKHLFGLDFLGEYKNLLKSYGLYKIKEELGIPLDRKVAILSFRKAENKFTYYKSDEEFLKATEDMVKQFKEKGFYIICRRRVGKNDINHYQQKAASDGYSRIAPYIDKEINGFGGFPSLVWKLVYASDVMLMSDHSGIALLEGALCKTIPYMNYTENEFTKSQFENLAPATKELVRDCFMSGEYTEDEHEIKLNKLAKFNKKWYNTNINLFWEKVLNV